ncbi:MAG TPA: LuxR C-terminal-related transcriptional regulator [Solirubrobacterales bacterium]|nr:LuxR C-terminal-related transcriptional regulator [Solirubrobacterales bacterium]
MEAPFIAREAELGELAVLIGETRLLTLTGPGGIGKTRLARELARREATRRSRRELLVAVDEAGGADALAGALLRDLGRREDPGRPPLDTLAEELGAAPALVVLDDCENLTPEAVAALATLLGRCPGLQVLASGRRPLGLDGERVWPVPPLSPPQAGATTLAGVLAGDATRLFLAAVDRHDPTFVLDAEAAATAARICDALDGFPLAIEVAAARAAELGLETVSAGLATVPAKDTEASLAWSYGLLAPECRRLLRRLGALAGCNATDAAAVDGGLDPAQAERHLAVLAGLGLVMSQTDPLLGTVRHELLDSVRDFALARLVEAGEEEAARDLHLAHFADLAARSRGLLGDIGGRRLLDLEARNLRAALEHAIDRGDELALAICEGLTYWWFAADRFAEGRELCARAIAACPDASPSARALVLRSAAILAVAVEDYPEAHAGAIQAHAMAQESDDARVRGLGLQSLNLVLGTVDPAAAATSGREAVELLRAGDEHDLAHALLTLAVAEALRDRFAAFDALRAEFMALRAGHGDEWLTTLMDLHTAWTLIGRGDPTGARAESEAVLRRLGREVSTRAALARAHRLHAMALGGEAGAALEGGLREMEAAREIGSEVGAATIEVGVAAAELALGDLAAVEARAAANLDSPAVHGAAFWRDAMAAVAVERGEPAAVAEHAVALGELASRSGSPRQQGRSDYFLGLAALREDEAERATDLLHRALALQAESLCERDAIDTLEGLALLAARRDEAERGARLAGAAAAARRTRGCVRMPGPGRWTAAADGEDEDRRTALARARVEGERLSLAGALAYARRSRGRRDRALAGWASLTPTEEDVARLAAEGLSNPQIAGRLFMSRSTVKTHLSHAYAKLGVANRTELAAGLARGIGQVADVSTSTGL